jgi:3-isopropylmalate/(R)-2-methylmalate dehydratase small subunit
MARVIAKLADDVSTDVIYPGRFMATVLPSETPQFAFADDAELNALLRSAQLAPGSVSVAGKNFGCGSSREQACSCLKGYELTIVAKGVFLQNSIILGLNLLTVPDFEASEGDELEITAGKADREASVAAVIRPGADATPSAEPS